MIKIVYLDMDGVITDFNRPATAVIDAEYPPKRWHWYDDFENGFERVNAACNIEFWRDLKWEPDGHDIFRLILNSFKPEQVYLLTTPMPNPGSATGKTLWVKQNLPSYEKRLIITRAPKSLLARPDTLLIDDRDKNVEEFRKAGGYAILVPRPWNKMHRIQNDTVVSVGCSLAAVETMEDMKCREC